MLARFLIICYLSGVVVAVLIPPYSNGDITYRPVRSCDQEQLWTILQEAAHVTNTPIACIQTTESLRQYAERFGDYHGDMGVLAETGETLVGAAWVRLLPNGFATSVLDNQDPVRSMPELAIATLPSYRGRGIGSRLLLTLLNRVKSTGQFPGVCLSCRVDNHSAMRLYERIGFKTIQKQENQAEGSSVTMLYRFRRG